MQKFLCHEFAEVRERKCEQSNKKKLKLITYQMRDCLDWQQCQLSSFDLYQCLCLLLLQPKDFHIHLTKHIILVTQLPASKAKIGRNS